MPDKPSLLVQPGSPALLSRILEQPNLPAQVHSLPPQALGKLIDHIGLHDAGEIVALATTEQLAHVFDEDLWSNQRPGEEEKYDAARFLVWLEVMLEAGDAFVAKRLAELPEDMLTLALHRHVLVLELDALALQMQEADEQDARQLDKALESCLYEEVGSYQLMARNPDGWDAILAAVLALDTEHHALLDRVLSHCAHLAAEYIDDNGGLYEVLTSEAMLEGDLAGEREERRAAQGHVAPTLAKSFLALARGGADTPLGEHDPVTKAYFRGLAQTPAAARPTAAPRARLDTPRTASSLLALLRAAGVTPAPQCDLLLSSPEPSAGRDESLLVHALRDLAQNAPGAFAARSEELAYLTNAMVSGCSFRGRRMRPIEGLRAVMGACNLALELSIARSPRATVAETLAQAATLLETMPADGLFRLAWSTVHDDIVDRAARVAEALLLHAQHGVPAQERASLQQGLAVLRRARASKEPWRGAPKLELLVGILEPVAVDSLMGLLDECPTLPQEPAKSIAHARRDRDEAPVRFISSMAELQAARRFLVWLEKKPDTPGHDSVEKPKKKRSPRRTP